MSIRSGLGLLAAIVVIALGLQAVVNSNRSATRGLGTRTGIDLHQVSIRPRGEVAVAALGESSLAADVASAPQALPYSQATIVALLPSPKYSFDNTLYVLTERELFRSTDGGESWAILTEQAEGKDDTVFVQGAIVDLVNNRHELLLATARGELRHVDPSTGTWQPYAKRVDPTKLLPGEFSLEKALGLLYGSQSIYTDELGRSYARTGEGSEVSVVYANHLGLLESGDATRYLLITETTPGPSRLAWQQQCFGCSFAVDGARFEKIGYGWHLATQPGGIKLVSQVGAIPEAQIVQLGPVAAGARFDTTWRADGNVRTTATWLAEVDGIFREVLRIPIAERNSQTLPCLDDETLCFEYNSVATLEEGDNPDYKDIHVTVTGTHSLDDAVEPVDELRIYTFDGERYVLAETSYATGRLEIDIEYVGEFYVRTFGYAPDAPNIVHYVLVIPEEERQRFVGVPVFSSIRFPNSPDKTAQIRDDRSEYAWIREYIHRAPQGHFRSQLMPGRYLIQVAFLAAPLDRDEAGMPDDAILWAGITGGGASTRGYREVQIEPGLTQVLQFTLTDEHGWACPWLYFYDGKQFVRITEILRDTYGKNNQTTERTELGPIPVIDGAVRLQLREEKPETAYFDAFFLLVEGQRVLPSVPADAVTSLSHVDGEYLALYEGETVELFFPLPAALASRTRVNVTVMANGYSIPHPAADARLKAEALDSLVKVPPSP